MGSKKDKHLKKTPFLPLSHAQLHSRHISFPLPSLSPSVEAKAIAGGWCSLHTGFCSTCSLLHFFHCAFLLNGFLFSGGGASKAAVFSDVPALTWDLQCPRVPRGCTYLIMGLSRGCSPSGVLTISTVEHLLLWPYSFVLVFTVLS